jgi:hypothetical protein
LASHIILLHSWWTLTIAYPLRIARVVILSICFIVNLYCFLNKLVFFAWFGCQLNHQTSLSWQGRDIIEGIGGFYCL